MPAYPGTEPPGPKRVDPADPEYERGRVRRSQGRRCLTSAAHALAVGLGVRDPGLPGSVEVRITAAATVILLLGALSSGSLSDATALVLAVACLPLARSQASLLWRAALHSARLESWAARHGADREMLHKAAWVLVLGGDQWLVLGPARGSAWWGGAPFAFEAVLPVLSAATLGLLVERSIRGATRTRSGPWSWGRVQVSAGWEELLFRGLLPAVVWPLFAVPPGAVGLRWILAACCCAALFAFAHWRGGTPSGVVGVAFTFGLALACLGLDRVGGSILPGYLLHGIVLGSLGFGPFWVARVGARRRVAGARGLFLLRLRHAWYVSDWEGERVLPLIGAESEPARRLRARLGQVTSCRALDRDEWGPVLREGRDPRSTGEDWLREEGHYLIALSPAGALPSAATPRTAHAILMALEASTNGRARSTGRVRSSKARATIRSTRSGSGTDSRAGPGACWPRDPAGVRRP